MIRPSQVSQVTMALSELILNLKINEDRVLKGLSKFSCFVFPQMLPYTLISKVHFFNEKGRCGKRLTH